MAPTIDRSLFASAFDDMIDGKATGLYFLQNNNGVTAALTNYGARLVRLNVPDVQGRPVDVVAGFDTLAAYLSSTEPYYGAVIGRYCNRISGAVVELANQRYALQANDGQHSLHGGTGGFHQRVWDVSEFSGTQITFCLLSPHLDQGFPGNLRVEVTYTLNENNELSIRYVAITDLPTVINLTNHAYFNLNGVGKGLVTGHWLTINADHYMPVDDQFIPTGSFTGVGGGPFDFREGMKVGTYLASGYLQLSSAGGYNHNYVLNSHALDLPVAHLIGDQSGIDMEVLTDQPGIQLYTADYLSGHNLLRGNNPDVPRSLIALETQHFPDSVKHPSFPTTILNPGEKFNSFTTYRFRADN